MKTRWKILIALGVFFGLLGASMVMTMRFQPENQLEAYKKFLRDHGEKLEISQVVPPRVPAESNSVDAVEAAFRMFGSGDTKIPDAMQMVTPGKAMTAWRQPDVRGYDFTNSWDEFADAVESGQPAIDLLHRVLDRPRLDFQLDYRKDFDLMVPQLGSLKRASQKLEAAALLDLHNGDPDAATTNILILLALVQRNEGDGLLISDLVRIAMTANAVAPTWELLQSTNVTNADLVALQQGWAQMNYLYDAEKTFVMERAWMPSEIQKYRASHEEFKKSVVGSSLGGSSSAIWDWPPDWEAVTEETRAAVGEVMWRSSWSFSEEFRTLKSHQIILETLRTMQTNQSQFYKADYDAMTSRMSSLGITNAGEAFFRTLKIPDFSETFGGGMYFMVSKILRVEVARRIIITAIALKRFQLKHGKWPETLGELVPEFIPSLPIDPYDGKPLRYHPNADGTFLLYCVGEDGVDDGGDPSLPPSVMSTSYNWQNPKARDWVWPQPATTAEIQSYYEAQARKSK